MSNSVLIIEEQTPSHRLVIEQPDTGTSLTIEQTAPPVLRISSGGDAGASAYDLAVLAGYPGTLAEWLLSLQGPPGAGGTGSTRAVRRYFGVGEPITVIVGSSPGDEYVDADTGIIYQLT